VDAARLAHRWPPVWAMGAGGVLGNGSGLKLCKSPHSGSLKNEAKLTPVFSLSL